MPAARFLLASLPASSLPQPQPAPPYSVTYRCSLGSAAPLTSCKTKVHTVSIIGKALKESNHQPGDIRSRGGVLGAEVREPVQAEGI